MKVKKIILNIHLWLGFISGLLVLFLGITGCLLAFEQEIRVITQPYQFIEPCQQPFVSPTRLKAIAEKQLAGKKINGIEYPGKGKAAIAGYYDAENYMLVYLNPYSGAVLKIKNMKRDFFRIIVDGHFYLWLPPAIGQPIVASATLIFVVMMVTGIILWYPKNKAARRQRFSIKWNAKWRRMNYDLHNVFGFYMTWIAIFIALTGLIWGFQWFARSVYWISSGGETMVEHKQPVSDTTAAENTLNVTDLLWKKHTAQLQENESLSVYFARDKAGVVEIAVNHCPGTYYNTDTYHYDQYTAKELSASDSYAGRFKDAAIADKIVRMNYDMHTGSILGLPGKILAFLASLVAASLPVTGFMIWRGRRKKEIRQTLSFHK